MWDKAIVEAAEWPPARQIKSSFITMYRRKVRVGGNLTLSSPTPPLASQLQHVCVLTSATNSRKISKQLQFETFLEMCERAHRRQQTCSSFLFSFLPFTKQPACVWQQQLRACVCACDLMHPPTETREPSRCSCVPDKLLQFSGRCHQCELEKRWICSAPRRCYFDPLLRRAAPLGLWTWDEKIQ